MGPSLRSICAVHLVHTKRRAYTNERVDEVEPDRAGLGCLQNSVVCCGRNVEAVEMVRIYLGRPGPTPACRGKKQWAAPRRHA
jgi:hypothetical protein